MIPVSEVLVELILLILDGALFPWGKDLGNLELGNIPPERIHIYLLVSDTGGSCCVRELYYYRASCIQLKVFDHPGDVNSGRKYSQWPALWLQLVRGQCAHPPPTHTHSNTHTHVH